MTNPSDNSLPNFSEIDVEKITPTLDKILNDNRAEISAILTNNIAYAWENLMRPCEDIDDRLSQMWSKINHLNAVMNNEKLRVVYHECLPKLSEYSTEMGQNAALFEAIKSLSQNDFKNLEPAQQKVIENEIRDFKLSGVHLEPHAKKRYAELQHQLARLTTLFEENLLDATNGWNRLITNEEELKGLPKLAIDAARELAKEKGLEGWLFTLDFPSYQAVITYADSRELREEIYTAYVTRSSDQGPYAGQWDNTEIMQEILLARKEIAHLLGYKNYSELSIVPKMVASTEEVLKFLNELASASIEQAREEFTTLSEYAKAQGVNRLEAWDIPYYSEKLKHHLYDISEEELRPYFPEHRVIQGLFSIVNRLFGLQIQEVKNADVWHKDVTLYEVRDEHGNLRGHFYFDLYARANKRGGAWMDECRSRRIINGAIQTPIAFLTCNFNRPVGKDPALFSHYDVTTLFHEFGHGLHHILTKVDYPDVGGINGVPWDAVELPSQFLENWCWEKEALDMISGHYQTNEKIPDALFQKMFASKNFQSAMQMVRQLEFSIFDFRLHMDFKADEQNQIQKFLDEARLQVCVIPIPEFNRFQHSFSHIFAGGYAAGYYSYKWAEVLSSDAYSKFEETGIFDKKTGREFLENILEKGGSEDPLTLFVKFRGRKPTTDALLRHSGIRK